MDAAASGACPARQSPGQRVEPSSRRKPASFFLDGGGIILDCCREAEACFGFSRGEMAGQHISQLFPQLEGDAVLEQGCLSWRLARLSPCRHSFRARDRAGNVFESELSFVEVIAGGQIPAVRVIAQPI
jgi:PAS domain S-box-containing protein